MSAAHTAIQRVGKAASLEERDWKTLHREMTADFVNEISEITFRGIGCCTRGKHRTGEVLQRCKEKELRKKKDLH